MKDFKPIDLTNDRNVYKFIKQTESDNGTHHLGLPEDIEDHQILLKAIKQAMNEIKKRQALRKNKKI